MLHTYPSFSEQHFAYFPHYWRCGSFHSAVSLYQRHTFINEARAHLSLFSSGTIIHKEKKKKTTWEAHSKE